MKRTTVGIVLVMLALATVPSLAGGKPAKAEKKDAAGDALLEQIDQALELARKNRRTGEVEIRLIVKDAQDTTDSLDFVKTVASSGGGKTVTALPGYCKTPPASLPEPVPYPHLGEGKDPTKATKEDLAGAATIAVENTAALLGYLRKLKKQVHLRDNYVSGLTRKNRLVKADKEKLERSLLAIRKQAESVLDEFDRFIEDIQRFREQYLAAPNGS